MSPLNFVCRALSSPFALHIRRTDSWAPELRRGRSDTAPHIRILLSRQSVFDACQTEPSVQSVRLIGSWDNFTMCYSMERDSRRGHGQWRGCFAFQNVMYDHGSSHHDKRSGGLKMGHTYFYYYEVDGSTETFDTTMPYTTACPYMPGQTVNTLQVPIERTARFRSASTTSVHLEDFRTMNPATKFMKPLPPTPLSPGTNKRCSHSAPHPSIPSSRSTSPRSWRRFFSRKIETPDSQRAASAGSQETTFTAYDNVVTVSPPPHARAGRHVSSLSEGARPRDISPSSLSRILREGRRHPPRVPSHTAQLPPLKIPQDVIEHDDEDEDFTASAISESLPFATVLSPPPFQRSLSSETVKQTTEAGSSSTIAKPSLSVPISLPKQKQPISAVTNETMLAYEWPVTGTEQVAKSPNQEDVPMSFYDDEEDDDDVLSSNEDEGHVPPAPSSQSLLSSFKGYSLPGHVEEKNSAFLQQTYAYRSSLKLLSDRSNLLDTPIEAGLDDFVSELRWIAAAIGTQD
ncbi:hypothetical protein M440DRAFT_1148289 [Trichoderma longibrachiatum ATCC 18648]|uniref:Uncharacterized protein n=1 Tax=Trichoderma longibrachiatum ATCC 18648 TaxID=983965 RepID=A0A2T4BPU7_TRILO|nr:hypothetical protein M440DRAFT_1148289 [Trichoderma longibrachiatum ATCC 18648]